MISLAEALGASGMTVLVGPVKVIILERTADNMIVEATFQTTTGEMLRVRVTAEDVRLLYNSIHDEGSHADDRTGSKES